MRKLLLALCAILAVATARVVIIDSHTQNPHLLGSEECTWGPSYWCENLKTAAGCNATKHCIKMKWESMEVPEDNDSVCDICKDMVQQARDQLESNQTQQDLKDVFEGSCKLIHIKPIVSECITLVDQFIPELVETLASQMNPSVVCSVAGLCNSARIDKMLQEFEPPRVKKDGPKVHSLENDELEPDECSKCFTVATHMEHSLQQTGPDAFLKRLLVLCGEFGSFSDACSSIMITHFDTIYEHAQKNFNADNICHLSGQCSAKFHKHEGSDVTPKVEIRPLSSVGMVEVTDDLPCKLCEQLVGHLRDLLVANTTEAEFEQVLKGLCKQTKSFATECTAIVEEYYPQIYDFLMHGLNSNLVCQMSGLCPKPGESLEDVPLAPLLPPKQREIAVRILKGAEKSKTAKPMEIDSGSEELTASEVEALQLPIERTVPFALQQEGFTGKQSCALCEYILHYVQEAITDPTTENNVKDAMRKVCTKLPKSIKGECSEFVDTYGDAVIALMAQEIDPSQVCPMLHFCPSKELLEIWKKVPKEYIMEEHVEDKPSCPLCLLAVTQIYEVIKNNKTEADIEAELDKLCAHLPQSLANQCTDLVKGYSKELIELLLADLTPQEICVYIKLCDDQKDPGPRNLFITDRNGEILTNEIPDYQPQPQHPPQVSDDVPCVICEFVMQYVDKAISTKKNREEIERVVHGVCNHLPKTVARECNDFVDEYAEVVIDILSKDVSPKEVCSMIGLCHVGEKQMQESVAECALCQAVISTLDKLLDDPKVDAEIEETVAKVCKYIPAAKQNKCDMMIKIYGQSIINLFKDHTDSKQMCTKIALCSSSDYLAMSLKSPRRRRAIGSAKRCTWGQSYWCITNDTARECGMVEHCREKVWKAESATASKQPASNKVESSA